MARRSLFLAGFFSFILFASLTPYALAQEGKDLFQKQCASCHTIGGGDGVGPDLKGVGSRRSAEWLVRIITEPDKLTADKDPAQLELVKKYGMEMPKLGVSRGDAEKIVAFLQGGQPAAAPAPVGAPAAPETAKGEVVPTPQLLAEGRALFTGKTAFARGGPPCVSCHTLRYPDVYGGALARDITDIYKNMGNAGVRGVLSSLSFPVMKAAYADRPLSDTETTALLALFKDASLRNQRECNPYPLTGLGFFVAFVIIAVLVKRRIR